MNAVQEMRQEAQKAGNLKSTSQVKSAIRDKRSSLSQLTQTFTCQGLTHGSSTVLPSRLGQGGIGIRVCIGLHRGFAFGIGFNVGFFGGFGWGWHHWAPDWHHHDILYNHNRTCRTAQLL